MSVYDPLVCGSIDGTTDSRGHDKAVVVASKRKYKPSKSIEGSAKHTIFVGRLSTTTTETTLSELFSKHGKIVRVRLIRDLVTGASKRYGFVEFKHSSDAKHAYKYGHKIEIDGRCVLVDWEHARMMPGWVPRRLGGGFGGKKESGQLRFGCRDRPFKRPLCMPQNSSQGHREMSYHK